MGLLDGAEWAGRLFTGEWVPSEARPVVEPATGERLGEVGVAGVGEVARAGDVAAGAGRAWAGLGGFERAAVLRRAAALFEEHSDEIAGWVVREAGSTRFKAGVEVSAAVAECLEAAALATAPHGELLHSPAPRLSVRRRVPSGVVSVISPFNFPLVLAIRSVAPALALGNAVLLKPDPRTAVSGGVVLARVLQEAGLPEGVLHVLPGGREVGEAVVDHPAVRVVSFTGSTAAGREVGARAARALTRSVLELGGNSALVVLADADPAQAAACGAFGSFVHAGQVCMAVGRHLVHESRYDEYVELLAGRAEGLRVGDGHRDEVELGPLIDARQADRVADLVSRSVASGARVVAGGGRDGLFHRPTVLAGCADSTPAYREEVFGPVACVRPFRDVAEAVRLAADSEHGLSLGVVTGDVAAGLALADLVPSGAVHVNDQTFNDDANAPFGGVGASGFGRVGGVAANSEAFTETQWVTARRAVPGFPF
ncbi:aldehyde dehydrogenase family protein [Actinosynnema pretiosum]|uniref:Benzaldehyde dehydrogenase n=1 Tax=Actinosynnema pretiosum TaxID=42197 RepID=A0A290Z500_9PSEU|nr:aldehyde dehydrogenase family protein [Actinosynnema pretiosum]ATE54049.1 benzaldehyde dehydrogenase [Actinosynnema pretiosum]